MQLTSLPQAEAIEYDSLQRAGELGGRWPHARHDPWPRSASFWMVACYMVLFLIRPWELLYPWMEAFPIERTFAILVIATVVLGGQSWFKFTGQTTTILAFLGALSLSAMLGLEPAKSGEELYKYITVVAWYFFLNSVVRTPRALLAMQTWWLFVWGLYMLKALWEYYCGRYDWHQGIPRMMGIEATYGNVNEYCACVTFTLPSFFSVFRSRAEYSPRVRRWLTCGLAGFLLMAMTSIVLTNSRSGMIKAIFFFFLASLRGGGLFRKVGQLVVAVVILLGIWIVMPETSRTRFQTLWDPSLGPQTSIDSANARFEQDGLKLGFKAMGEFPLTGIGIGNFVTYRVQYDDGQPLEAHNLYGQVMGETGILGTITFVSMVVVILANCRRVRAAARVDPDPRLKMMSECCISCRDTILLLLLSGFAGHLMLFYHWIWMAAFSQCALRCMESIRRQGSG
jgi:O-antigen ligase